MSADDAAAVNLWAGDGCLGGTSLRWSVEVFCYLCCGVAAARCSHMHAGGSSCEIDLDLATWLVAIGKDPDMDSMPNAFTNCGSKREGCMRIDSVAGRRCCMMNRA